MAGKTGKGKRGLSNAGSWCRRANEVAVALSAVATRLPFLDNRPNVVPDVAEIREYYGYYQKKNVVVSGRGATTIPLSVPGGPHV